MGPLSVEEMNASRLAIVRHVQQNEYAKEISMLQTDEQARLLRVSSLQNLCPVLQEGVLRVGGRLENAEVDYEVKHPVIIPGKHRVAELVIRDYHQNNGHVGLNMMKAMIRQEFWITQITAAVRRVLSDCFICKRNHQAPCHQRMALLPAERLVANHPPFTFVGVDYFSPMLVVQGRSHVKRYACLFTCLATRQSTWRLLIRSIRSRSLLRSQDLSAAVVVHPRSSATTELTLQVQKRSYAVSFQVGIKAASTERCCKRT